MIHREQNGIDYCVWGLRSLCYDLNQLELGWCVRVPLQASNAYKTLVHWRGKILNGRWLSWSEGGPPRTLGLDQDCFLVP